MVKPCIECGCDSFVANPFKKGKCAACFHVHEGDTIAAAKQGPPTASQTPTRVAAAATPRPTGGGPSPAVNRRASLKPPPPKAAPPPKARASTRKAPPSRPGAPARQAKPAAPAPAPAPGLFTSLEDVMKHVEAIKASRIGQLGHAAMLVQQALRRLLARLRAKATALADVCACGVVGLQASVNVAELDFNMARVHQACFHTPRKATIVPFFLDPLNAQFRADADDFQAPEEVVEFATTLRVARLELLHTSQAVIRAAYFSLGDALARRGEVLAQAAYMVIVEDMATASSEATLERCSARLDSLQAVLPSSQLAVDPFVAKVNEYLPPAGDASAAQGLGVGVPPEAPLAGVADVVAYGGLVRAHRRSILDACQVCIKKAFTAFTTRLGLRAAGLADLVTSRVLAMDVAASDTELTALLDTVTSAIELVPKSSPAPATFVEVAQAGLPAAPAAFELPYEVFEYAETVEARRLEELHAAATVLAGAYRRYRGRMYGAAVAYGQLTASVLYSFGASVSDYGLERQAWRLGEAVQQVPASDATALGAFLETANAEYHTVVQDVSYAGCPMPPFGSVEDIVAHGAALADQRLGVLNDAQVVIRGAFKGYKARVGFAAVAMAELVMSTIREFECALDREMDLLTTKVERAMLRVRGNKDAERLFLDALNKHMEASKAK